MVRNQVAVKTLPRGVCGVCGGERVLKNDGHLVRHGDQLHPMRTCQGSGTAPVDPRYLPDEVQTFGYRVDQVKRHLYRLQSQCGRLYNHILRLSEKPQHDRTKLIQWLCEAETLLMTKASGDYGIIDITIMEPVPEEPENLRGLLCALHRLTIEGCNARFQQKNNSFIKMRRMLEGLNDPYDPDEDEDEDEG